MSDTFYCTRCKNKNFLIECGCGCGNILSYRNKWGDNRRYVLGHGPHPAFNKKNEEHPGWKGDDVGYKGLHIWIGRHFVRPNSCELCHTSLGKEWANVTGVYNRDRMNWKYLCAKCHHRIDHMGFKKGNTAWKLKKTDTRFQKRHSYGIATRYQKGQVPWNKGKPNPYAFFKKGHPFYGRKKETPTLPRLTNQYS